VETAGALARVSPERLPEPKSSDKLVLVE